MLRGIPAGCGARPDADASGDVVMTGVADHGGAGNPEPGEDVPELPVAVGGLVEVHEVHVDGVPRQGLVGLGVQMQ